MAGDATLTFNEQNFQSEVLGSSQPVLVDFWAEWCMPCKMLTPTIDQVAQEFQGRAKVGKVNTDENRNLAAQYQISAIPTILLFKGGQVVEKFVGMTGKDKFAQAISANL